MTNWIRTRDRYPEDGQKVIYFFEYVGVHRGNFMWDTVLEEFYNEKDELVAENMPVKVDVFYSNRGWLTQDVTHWMPDEGQELPEQPTELE